jgi:hypothetical protein
MSNSDYFTERSRQERLAAQGASDPHIAAVHAKMADLYDAAAKGAATQSAASAPLLRHAR